jgi:hypothetical protein
VAWIFQTKPNSKTTRRNSVMTSMEELMALKSEWKSLGIRRTISITISNLNKDNLRKDNSLNQLPKSELRKSNLTFWKNSYN